MDNSILDRILENIRKTLRSRDTKPIYLLSMKNDAIEPEPERTSNTTL